MSFIIFIPHFRLPPISPRTGRADKQKDNGAGDEISTNDGHGERWVAFLETPSRPRRKDSLALRFEERARTTYYLLQDVDGRPPCECAGTFCERARIFVNVHEYLRTCTNICECARIPTNVWENARVFLGRTGNFRATYTRPIDLHTSNLLCGAARAYVSFAYSVIQKRRAGTSDGGRQYAKPFDNGTSSRLFLSARRFGPKETRLSEEVGGSFRDHWCSTTRASSHTV